MGLLVDRSGHVSHVLVGTADKLLIPDLGRHRVGRSRFRGLRLLHTHLGDDQISKDDLNDLTLLRLDLVLAVEANPDGRPGRASYAHLLPTNPAGELWRVEGPMPVHELSDNFQELVAELEAEFAETRGVVEDVEGADRVILVSVHNLPAAVIDERMEELRELARSAGLRVVDEVSQRRVKPDGRFVMGQGKLDELIFRSMQVGADVIVFENTLSPSPSFSSTDGVFSVVVSWKWWAGHKRDEVETCDGNDGKCKRRGRK